MAKKTAMVGVLESWLCEPRRVRCVVVNSIFAIVKIDDAWQVVHRKSGLRTSWHRAPEVGRRQMDVIAMAMAATKRYATILNESDPRVLIDALRAAGSVQWSKAWWEKRRKVLKERAK